MITEILNDAIGWIGAHKSELGILGGLISAIAAVLSSYNARKTKVAADEMVHRVEVRQAIVDAKSVVVEFERIKRLGIELCSAYRDLGVFVGASGGSREEMYKKAAAEKVNHAEVICEAAVSAMKSPELLETESAKGLGKRRIEFAVVLVELTALREEIMREIDRLNEQIKPLRERRLMGS